MALYKVNNILCTLYTEDNTMNSTKSTLQVKQYTLHTHWAHHTLPVFLYGGIVTEGHQAAVWRGEGGEHTEIVTL